MRAYWDASALVETTVDADLRRRLVAEGGLTRTHTLTEIFSTLTGKAHIRMDANAAAATVEALTGHLEFVDLTARGLLEGLKKAQALGVRGSRVHDYVHALAAKKARANLLLTLDRNDFESLAPGITVEQV